LQEDQSFQGEIATAPERQLFVVAGRSVFSRWHNNSSRKTIVIVAGISLLEVRWQQLQKDNLYRCRKISLLKVR
jgi:hypothetical protein